jgi:hypothetical protein
VEGTTFGLTTVAAYGLLPVGDEAILFDRLGWVGYSYKV